MLRHLADVLIAWGPAGILVLAVLDSIGVPVAGVFDALLIFVSANRPSVAWLCAGFAVLGSTVGNVILFSAAHRGGRMFMERAAPGGRAARFRKWFRRYGMATVFVPALIPIPLPLKLFVVSAGVMGTGLGEFISIVVVARVLRYFGEAWLGIMLGRQSAAFLRTHVWQLVGGAVILFGAICGFIWWRDRSRGRAQA